MSTENNPYEAPIDVEANDHNEDAARAESEDFDTLRRQHLNTEANLKGLGALILLEHVTKIV